MAGGPDRSVLDTILSGAGTAAKAVGRGVGRFTGITQGEDLIPTPSPLGIILRGLAGPAGVAQTRNLSAQAEEKRQAFGQIVLDEAQRDPSILSDPNVRTTIAPLFGGERAVDEIQSIFASRLGGNPVGASALALLPSVGVPAEQVRGAAERQIVGPPEPGATGARKRASEVQQRAEALAAKVLPQAAERAGFGVTISPKGAQINQAAPSAKDRVAADFDAFFTQVADANPTLSTGALISEAAHQYARRFGFSRLPESVQAEVTRANRLGEDADRETIRQRIATKFAGQKAFVTEFSNRQARLTEPLSPDEARAAAVREFTTPSAEQPAPTSAPTPTSPAGTSAGPGPAPTAQPAQQGLPPPPTPRLAAALDNLYQNATPEEQAYLAQVAGQAPEPTGTAPADAQAAPQAAPAAAPAQRPTIPDSGVTPPPNTFAATAAEALRAPAADSAQAQAPAPPPTLQVERRPDPAPQQPFVLGREPSDAQLIDAKAFGRVIVPLPDGTFAAVPREMARARGVEFQNPDEVLAERIAAKMATKKTTQQQNAKIVKAAIDDVLTSGSLDLLIPTTGGFGGAVAQRLEASTANRATLFGLRVDGDPRAIALAYLGTVATPYVKALGDTGQITEPDKRQFNDFIGRVASGQTSPEEARQILYKVVKLLDSLSQNPTMTKEDTHAILADPTAPPPTFGAASKLTPSATGAFHFRVIDDGR